MDAQNNSVQPHNTPNPHDSSNEYEMLRAVLAARDNEIAILCARLQQNNETLATVVEQLEKTVAASIDRFVRRLDRMENRHNRVVGGGGGYDNHSFGAGDRNKRSRYSR